MRVRLWEIGEYDQDIRLPALISLMWIRGGLGLSIATAGNSRVWATIGLNKGQVIGIYERNIADRVS